MIIIKVIMVIITVIMVIIMVIMVIIVIIMVRASYKEFGHSHWWELIEIFVPKFGNWFSSLFPKW